MTEVTEVAMTVVMTGLKANTALFNPDLITII